MKIIAVIPARLNSTRLPNKLLRDVYGKTLIRRTYEATKNSSLFDDVLVVTNSEEILKELKKGEGVITTQIYPRFAKKLRNIRKFLISCRKISDQKLPHNVGSFLWTHLEYKSDCFAFPKSTKPTFCPLRKSQLTDLARFLISEAAGSGSFAARLGGSRLFLFLLLRKVS